MRKPKRLTTSTSGKPSDTTDCGADQNRQGDIDKEGSERSSSDAELRNVCHSLNEQTIE